MTAPLLLLLLSPIGSPLAPRVSHPLWWGGVIPGYHTTTKTGSSNGVFFRFCSPANTCTATARSISLFSSSSFFLAATVVVHLAAFTYFVVTRSNGLCRYRLG